LNIMSEPHQFASDMRVLARKILMDEKNFQSIHRKKRRSCKIFSIDGVEQTTRKYQLPHQSVIDTMSSNQFCARKSEPADKSDKV
jgi:hypothetical protein